MNVVRSNLERQAIEASNSLGAVAFSPLRKSDVDSLQKAFAPARLEIRPNTLTLQTFFSFPTGRNS